MEDGTTSEFERNGYTLVRRLVEPAFAESLARTAHLLHAAGATRIDKIGTPIGYRAIPMEQALIGLVPVVERASARRLWPTYSFFRIYSAGDELKRHTDRAACEISLSLCLRSDTPEPWPLWIEGPNGRSAVEMSPGDAILYKGIECPHWRTPLPGGSLTQVFLHYVDRDGPRAHLRWDGHPTHPLEALKSPVRPR